MRAFIAAHPLFFYALFYGACITVTILSLLPSSGDTPPFLHWDKVMHGTAFMVLAILGGFAHGTELSKWWRSAIGLVFLGAAIEVFQSWTTWRQAEYLDWVADITGIILAIPLLIAINRLILKHGNEHISS